MAHRLATRLKNNVQNYKILQRYANRDWTQKIQKDKRNMSFLLFACHITDITHIKLKNLCFFCPFEALEFYQALSS